MKSLWNTCFLEVKTGIPASRPSQPAWSHPLPKTYEKQHVFAGFLGKTIKNKCNTCFLDVKTGISASRPLASSL